MTLGGVVRSLAALVVGLAAGAAVALMLFPRADVGSRIAATPGEQEVIGWGEAAALAGVPLYEPKEEARPDSLKIHGVAGDPIRPVEARFEGGLTLLQTHRDVLPAEKIGPLVSVPGADDVWWQVANDGRRLAVRFGDTLVLVWGLSDGELVAFASELARVDSAQ